MPDLRAVPGDPASPATGAIRGMINMMQKLRKDVRADYAACVFDAPGRPSATRSIPTTRRTARRCRPTCAAQIEPIHEVVRLLGWKVLNVPGVEADDVIGTLACMATEHGHADVISSGDKDLSQLVNEHVTVIDTMNDRRRDLAGRGSRVRRAAAADGGLPDAGRRRGRQRARRRQGRPQDGGQAAAGIRLAGQPGRRTPTRSRAPSARTCASAGLAAQGPRPADHPQGLRPGRTTSPACRRWTTSSSAARTSRSSRPSTTATASRAWSSSWRRTTCRRS
jgi:hypothetical protein